MPGKYSGVNKTGKVPAVTDLVCVCENMNSGATERQTKS